MNAKAVVAASVLALGSSIAVLACVLADPPPIVTPEPQEPPRILVESVTPPPGQLLKTNPPCSNLTDCFVVPVSVDLNASIKYRVFVDLDTTGAATQIEAINNTDDGGVLAVPPDAGPGVRTLSFSLQQNPNFDPTQCHVITFIVAYDFFVDDFWKPLPPGGDTIYWFYQPNNDCTFYDAGALPEAGAD
jgi:hypothetical protein